MQQHDDVESFFDEVAVAGLLVTAVAQIRFMFENLELGQVAQSFQADGQLIRGILAGVIENGDFFDVGPHIRRNTL